MDGDHVCEACRKMFDSDNPICCLACKEDFFCSHECMWSRIALCEQFDPESEWMKDKRICEVCNKVFDSVGVPCPVCSPRMGSSQDPTHIFCSMACMWSKASHCAEYQTTKDQIPPWTPRSVMDEIYGKIRRDRDFLNVLKSKLKDPINTMLVFYTQDMHELCTLLSSSIDWKSLLIRGLEVVPSVETNHAGMSFVLAFYSSKDSKLVARIM